VTRGCHHGPFGQKDCQAFQLCRKAASLAETSARNIGWGSIDGEYRLAGTSRPSASAAGHSVSAITSLTLTQWPEAAEVCIASHTA